MAFQSPVAGEGVALFENLRIFAIEWSSSGKWLRSILNSLGYFPVSVMITLPLSIVVAYFLFKKVPLAGLYKVIFFFPSIISIVVMGLAFRNIFSPNGPLNSVLTALGIPFERIPLWLNDPGWTMPVLYLYAVWAGTTVFSSSARFPACRRRSPSPPRWTGAEPFGRSFLSTFPSCGLRFPR